MIEKATSTISFPARPESLCTATTRTIFLDSALPEVSTVNVKNEPWCSWNISPAEWNGKEWYATVHFHGDQLHAIHIGAGSPEFGTSRNDWSEEKELRRKQYHEGVLRDELGPPPYDFSWGTVASVFDSKGGTSSIIITVKEK